MIERGGDKHRHCSRACAGSRPSGQVCLSPCTIWNAATPWRLSKFGRIQQALRGGMFPSRSSWRSRWDQNCSYRVVRSFLALSQRSECSCGTNLHRAKVRCHSGSSRWLLSGCECPADADRVEAGAQFRGVDAQLLALSFSIGMSPVCLKHNARDVR